MYVHVRINLMSRRPDWSRCAGYVEGGSETWKTVSEGQSSDYLVDVLLAEIAKVDISEIRKDDNFQAMVSLGCTYSTSVVYIRMHIRTYVTLKVGCQSASPHPFTGYQYEHPRSPSR